MANAASRKQAVSAEEVVLTQAVEFEALTNVQERHGVIPREEVLAEIKWLNEKAETVE